MNPFFQTKKPPLMRIQSTSTWWFPKVNLLKLELLIHGKSRKIKGCTAPLKNAPREDFLHRREEKCTALLVSINIYCSTQIWLWEVIPEAFFFVFCDSNFEGWRLFSPALAQCQNSGIMNQYSYKYLPFCTCFIFTPNISSTMCDSHISLGVP